MTMSARFKTQFEKPKTRLLQCFLGALLLFATSAIGLFGWSSPGATTGMSPSAAMSWSFNTNFADPLRNYWTPFWSGYNASSFMLSSPDYSFRNFYAANHDFNTHVGFLRGTIGYLDIFTPLTGYTHNEIFGWTGQGPAVNLINDPQSLYWDQLNPNTTTYYDTSRDDWSVSGYDGGFYSQTYNFNFLEWNDQMRCANRYTIWGNTYCSFYAGSKFVCVAAESYEYRNGALITRHHCIP